MQELSASVFFDSAGIYAVTERLILRAPIDEDKLKYVDAFGTLLPSLANAYRLDEELLQDYWLNGVNSPEHLYCSICRVSDGEFVGNCSIEKLNTQPYELGIYLLKEHQEQGLGFEAVNAFINAFEVVAGAVTFTAEIEATNIRSQRLFRKLGFTPAGIATFIIKDPGELKRFEEAYLDTIDDNMRALAAEFGVEPRKLLSHLLVFKRAAEG